MHYLHGAVWMKPDQFPGFNHSYSSCLNGQRHIEFRGDNSRMAKPAADFAYEPPCAPKVGDPGWRDHAADYDVTIFEVWNCFHNGCIVFHNHTGSPLHNTAPGDSDTGRFTGSIRRLGFNPEC